VLDQRDGGAHLAVHIENEAAHVLFLLEVHARHRLVEQQQIRLHRQRPAQLDPLLQPVGQLAHRRLADMLDLEEIDDLLDLEPVLDLLVARRADRSTCQKKFLCIFSVRPDMMLSSVDMPLNSATFWKVRAMPEAAAS
jgi:hypothetical protein